MNRDDILRWAQEAGLETHPRKGEVRIGSAIITGCDSTEQVMRFAAIVEKAAAVAEREKCAQLCEKLGTEVPLEFGNTDFFQCAAAIRARGEK